MTVQATVGLTLQAVETVTLGDTTVGNPAITHQIPDAVTTLNASSTPPVSVVGSGEVTLASGAATLDLASCLGPTVNAVDCPVNFTGKKINAVKVKANPANTSPITIVAGATNGYLLFGAAGSLILGPGESFEFLGNGLTKPTVDSTHKTLDIASAQATAKFEIIIAGG